MGSSQGTFTFEKIADGWYDGKYAIFMAEDTKRELCILGIEGYDEQGNMLLSKINNSTVVIPLWVGNERYKGNDTVDSKPLPRKGRAYMSDRAEYSRDFSRVIFVVSHKPIIKSLNDFTCENNTMDVHDTLAQYTFFKTITFSGGNAKTFWGGRGHLH